MAGLYLSGAMLAPAAMDFYFGNPDWQVFAVSAFSVGAVCLASAIANRITHGDLTAALFLQGFRPAEFAAA